MIDPQRIEPTPTPRSVGTQRCELHAGIVSYVMQARIRTHMHLSSSRHGLPGLCITGRSRALHQLHVRLGTEALLSARPRRSRPDAWWIRIRLASTVVDRPAHDSAVGPVAQMPELTLPHPRRAGGPGERITGGNASRARYGRRRPSGTSLAIRFKSTVAIVEHFRDQSCCAEQLNLRWAPPPECISGDLSAPGGDVLWGARRDRSSSSHSPSSRRHSPRTCPRWRRGRACPRRATIR